MTDSSQASQGHQPRHYLHSPLYFVVCSFGVQLVAIAALVAAIRVAGARVTFESASISFFYLAAGMGIYSTIAWAVSLLLELPPLWRLFNTLLLPLVLVSQSIGLPTWAYGTLCAIALILYLPTIWTRVPYYPTSLEMYEAVSRQLPADEEIRLVDLGCGFAGLLCYLARQRPGSTFVGVELSPMAYVIAKMRAQLAGLNNVRIEFRDLWSIDLSQFTAVYAFLAPPPMAGLWEKVKEELPRGGLFLVNSFPVPGIEAEEISVEGPRQVTLYKYTV